MTGDNYIHIVLYIFGDIYKVLSVETALYTVTYKAPEKST